VLTEQAFRKEAELSQSVFERLLAWLDDGTESYGERYLEMRRRLVSYFDRRNRPAADELADETLTRVARTLEQSGVIATRPPARYCYVVARFVLLEDLRRDRRHVGLDDMRANAELRANLAEPSRTSTRCSARNASTASTVASTSSSPNSVRSSSTTTATPGGRRSNAAATWPSASVSP
jgi:hypothetical protein